MIFANEVIDGLTALIGALTALVIAITALAGVGIKVYLSLRDEMRGRSKENARKIEVTSQKTEENTQQIEKTKQRTDTMFHNLYARGQIALLTWPGIKARSRAAIADCDYDIPENMRRAYEPLIPTLRLLWQHEGHGMTDEEFAELVLIRLGEPILLHVCEPLKMTQFECLPLAVSLAKEPVNSSVK